MDERYEPTWHSALDRNRRANIGGKWRDCNVQPKRGAIQAVLDSEHPSRRSGDGERIRRSQGRSRLWTYQLRRSGVMEAYRRAFDEMNPHVPTILKTALVNANPQLFR